MAYCGVKPSCGFNHKGERVRVCKRHRHLTTTALGDKLKKAEPKREYHDQSKYYDKYRTIAHIKKKAAAGSKSAQEYLKRKDALKSQKVAKKSGPKRLTKPAPKKAAKAKVKLSPVAKATAPTTSPGVKAMKAARDKRYREKQKAQKALDAMSGDSQPEEIIAPAQ